MAKNCVACVQDKYRVLRKYGPYCYYCKTKLTRANCTIDHYWPRSLGYKTKVPACYTCNNRKGSKDPEIFIQDELERKFHISIKELEERLKYACRIINIAPERSIHLRLTIINDLLNYIEAGGSRDVDTKIKKMRSFYGKLC